MMIAIFFFIWIISMIFLVLAATGIIQKISNPKIVYNNILCFTIYLLTITNILKWKKRLIVEFILVEGSHKYARRNMTIHKYGNVIPIRTVIRVGNKSYHSKINFKTLSFLSNKNIKPSYITNDTINMVYDLSIKRMLKLKLINKEIEIL